MVDNTKSCKNPKIFSGIPPELRLMVWEKAIAAEWDSGRLVYAVIDPHFDKSPVFHLETNSYWQPEVVRGLCKDAYDAYLKYSKAQATLELRHEISSPLCQWRTILYFPYAKPLQGYCKPPATMWTGRYTYNQNLVPLRSFSKSKLVRIAESVAFDMRLWWEVHMNCRSLAEELLVRMVNLKRVIFVHNPLPLCKPSSGQYPTQAAMDSSSLRRPLALKKIYPPDLVTSRLRHGMCWLMNRIDALKASNPGWSPEVQFMVLIVEEEKEKEKVEDDQEEQGKEDRQATVMTGASRASDL